VRLRSKKKGGSGKRNFSKTEMEESLDDFEYEK
jgi:hypothetical protein